MFCEAWWSNFELNLVNSKHTLSSYSHKIRE